MYLSNNAVWVKFCVFDYTIFLLFSHLPLPLSFRSQQAFMQSSLSQPSPMMLSGPSLHSYPGVGGHDLGKPQSSLAYQQPSNTHTQHIPILFEPQLNQPSGMGGSQLIDTHLLQVWNKVHTT